MSDVGARRTLAGRSRGGASTTIRAAPRDEGVVELIVRRPAVDEREVVDEAELDVEDGLVGDSWSARGRSGGRPANRDAQITVTDARAVALAAGDRDRWALAGRSARRRPRSVRARTSRPGRGSRSGGRDRGDGRARTPAARSSRRASASRRFRRSTRPRAEPSTCAGSTPGSWRAARSASATRCASSSGAHGSRRRGSVASCPHAAAMSRPRVSRTVAGTVRGRARL